MIIEWEGREYDYDPARIDVGDGMVVKQHTGCGMRSFEKGVDDGDPACLQALLWIIKKQNGEKIANPRMLNFSLHDFYAAVMRGFIAYAIEEAQRNGEAVEETLDPTGTAPAGDN